MADYGFISLLAFLSRSFIEDTYQSDQLDAQLGELWLEFGERAELGGAGRGEIILIAVQVSFLAPR